MKKWQSEPPDSEGFWWLYGDEEFGTMGGNYTGSIPPDKELCIVDVRKFGSEGRLIGVASGRFIPLRPFNADLRQPGYIGVWQKVQEPELPND